MYGEAQIANREYLSTWENPKDVNYKWLITKSDVERRVERQL